MAFLTFCLLLPLLSQTANAQVNGNYVFYDKDGAVIEGYVNADRTLARRWIDTTLKAIPHDEPRPTVHARNLFHLSAIMWDVWVTYHPEESLKPYLFKENLAFKPQNNMESLKKTLSFAAYHFLIQRYSFDFSFHKPTDWEAMRPFFDNMLVESGYDLDDTSSAEAILGQKIADLYINYGYEDGAREKDNYKNGNYSSKNGLILPALKGAGDLRDPNHWQAIGLRSKVDENTGQTSFKYSRIFLGAEWGHVKPFSLDENDYDLKTRDDGEFKVYFDPGPPPQIGSPSEDKYLWNFEMVAIWSSHLDPTTSKLWDISPINMGNSDPPTDPDNFDHYYNYYDGGDDADGHDFNPVTGNPFKRQIVPLADYARAAAEYWADGADSETPAGHWFRIMNQVFDHPDFERKLKGHGEELDPLEWDILSYFTMGGAIHDAAIAAWSVKGYYDYVRPISALRYLASKGQRCDPGLPGYNPDGIQLHPGYIEVITEQSSREGQRHHHLKGHVGSIAFYAWKGPDSIENEDYDIAAVGWILGEKWWPYQKPDFITPPFAGYVSGHSVISRTGATILHKLTGSEYFPNGLFGYYCPKGSCFVFENGPSQDVTLQWTSYYDASDQAALSRIWGGIHPPVDDLPGREIGVKVGKKAFEHAKSFWSN